MNEIKRLTANIFTLIYEESRKVQHTQQYRIVQIVHLSFVKISRCQLNLGSWERGNEREDGKQIRQAGDMQCILFSTIILLLLLLLHYYCCYYTLTTIFTIITITNNRIIHFISHEAFNTNYLCWIPQNYSKCILYTYYIPYQAHFSTLSIIVSCDGARDIILSSSSTCWCETISVSDCKACGQVSENIYISRSKRVSLLARAMLLNTTLSS